jgi:hypothetical protein
MCQAPSLGRQWAGPALRDRGPAAPQATHEKRECHDTTWPRLVSTVIEKKESGLTLRRHARLSGMTTVQEFAARLRRSTSFIVGGPSDLIITEMEATPDDRASIVAFLAAEAVRFDRAADDFDAMDKADPADRCRCKAGHSRTLAAQIARCDDKVTR